MGRWAVIPRARGQRIAPKLIEAVESCAAGIGARQLLLAVSAYSPSLVGWYERLGYSVDENARYLHASPSSPPPFVLVKRVAS